MHAKGIDQKMIDVAMETGMPVKISPKYWAEHQGLGYHQAAIRELEICATVTGSIPFSAFRTAPAASCAMATAICISRGAATACSTACGPGLSACCFGAIPRPPRHSARRRTFSARTEWNYASLFSSRAGKVAAAPEDAAVTRTLR